MKNIKAMIRDCISILGDKKKPDEKAVRKTKIHDVFTNYDPLLTNVNPKLRHPHYLGGFKIWPSFEVADAARWRIMCHGNSTSLWPAYAWSLSLGKRLQDAGHSVAIFNGAGKGHSSSQELLRVIRDAPGIKPHLIIALSGICDLGYIANSKGHPFSHKYARMTAKHLMDTHFVNAVNFGYPDNAGPAEVWCRNQRFAKVVADEMGVDYLTILQPVQGFGLYPQSPEEIAFFQTKAKVILKGSNIPYGDAVTEFYTGVRQIIRSEPEKFNHVVDFTNIFADVPGAYQDHRHQSKKGVEHLAARICDVVHSRLQEREASGSASVSVKFGQSASAGE